MLYPSKSKLCVNTRRAKGETERVEVTAIAILKITECHVAYNYRLLKLGKKWLKITYWYLQLILPYPGVAQTTHFSDKYFLYISIRGEWKCYQDKKSLYIIYLWNQIP